MRSSKQRNYVIKSVGTILIATLLASNANTVYGKNYNNESFLKTTLSATNSVTKINKNSASIQTGNKLTLSLLNVPSDATVGNWYSTKKSVAVVSSKGIVTAKSQGIAYIKRKVTFKDGTSKIYYCKITVNDKKIAINKTKVTLDLSKSPTVELKVNGLPSGYTVRWETDDTDTVRLSASVGDSIKVKGLISFSCNVYAHVYNAQGKLYKTYECKVEVFGNSSGGNTNTDNSGGNISNSAEQKARINLDYSVVSAKDIIRHYTSIGKEGTSLGESEEECRQILTKVDKMIDQLYDIQGWDIDTPYNLAEYLTVMMTGGKISSSSNKDGSNAWYNIAGSLPYRISMTNSSSSTGTGKYFKEGIINGKSDCWGVVVCTELIINRAAERKGFSGDELKAEYVRQGSDHAINIITVKNNVNNKKYYFAYGINVNTSKVSNWRTCGASSSNDIVAEMGGGTNHCYEIVNGKLKKVDNLQYILLDSDGMSKVLTMNPEETVLYYASGIKEESFTIPNTVAQFTGGSNKYLKNLTVPKNVNYMSIGNLSKLTTLDIKGKNVECSFISMESPYVQNQLIKNGYFNVPEQLDISISAELLTGSIQLDDETLNRTYIGPKWMIKSSHASAIANAKYNGIPYELY